MKKPFILFRKMALALSWLLMAGPLLGQGVGNFGNEWVVPGQPYWKIPVSTTALYRITATDLASMGIPAGTDLSRIQLFYRGKEQALYLQGGEDGQLTGDDYILFYGKRNDGADDRHLYVPQEAHPHPYFSLFTDKSYYFLTIAASGTQGKRMARTQADASATPEGFHWQESLIINTNSYTAGLSYPLDFYSSQPLYYSHWDYGEGYTSSAGTFQQSLLSLADFATAANVPLKVEMVLTGRSINNRTVDLGYGRAPGAGNLQVVRQVSGFYHRYTRLENIEIPSAGVSPASTYVMASSNDLFSVSSIKYRFPQLTTMGGQNFRQFILNPNAAGTSTLKINGASAALTVVDITDENNATLLAGAFSDGSYTLGVPNTTAERRLVATASPAGVSGITPLSFPAINPAQPNYVIITHPLLRVPTAGIADPVQAYADFRASAQGGGYNVMVVNTPDLYNQFNYGNPGPLAIRRFLDYMLRQGGSKLQHVFLIGQGFDPQSYRDNFDGEAGNLVPNCGWPGSDQTLVMGLNGKDAFEPAVAIGRLQASQIVARSVGNVRTYPQAIVNYLNKVKEHSAAPMTQLWQKSIMNVSGGRTDWERESFRNYEIGFAQQATASVVGTGNGLMSNFTAADSTQEWASFVNEGKAMINYLGHSGADYADQRIRFANHPIYTNQGKYPFVLLNGCTSGNVFFEYNLGPTLAKNWVETPNRGAIAFMAVTHLAYPDPMTRYSQEMYKLLFGSKTTATMSLGQIRQQAVAAFVAGKSGDMLRNYSDLITAEQFTYLGDPAIVLFPKTQPDYALQNRTMHESSLPANARTLASTVRIGVPVSNLGMRADQGDFVLRITRSLDGGTPVEVYNKTLPAIAFADTLVVDVERDPTSGTQLFTATADPQNVIAESNETNNTGTLALQLAPLPVTLISFTAYAKNDDVELFWKTASEKDNAYFEVQYSTDAARFEAIGTVKGSGTTSQGASYRFVHPQVRQDVVKYYRLKQVDTDGTFSYTRTISISPGKPAGWSLSPNPAAGQTVLSGLAGEARIRVLDLSGKALHEQRVRGQEVIGLQALPPGSYVMQVEQNGRRENLRLLLVK